jgi:hypothetical protein
MPSPLFYLYQLYPIVHYPIIHILRREEHKLLFMHRYSKIPASNNGVHISYVCHGDECVGRRGTNQFRLVEGYLDVLVKHTTEIPPPTALVEVCPRLP